MAEMTPSMLEKAESQRSADGISDKHNSGDGKQPGTAESDSPRNVHGISWFLVVLSTLSSLLLYALDNTITADVIPIVVGSLGSSQKLPWLSVGFMIGGVTVVLPFGKLYGLFNAKHLYLLSVCLFMVGSALCGAAPTMNTFIVGRVLAGMGGNGMYFGVMTILSVNTSNKERPGYLSLCGLIFGIGMVLGPIMGGAFADSFATWRWAFYFNLCVGAVCCPVYLFLLPEFDPKSGTKFFPRLKEFDYVGAVLSVGMLVSIILAINFGGSLYAWNAGQTIALFVVFGLLVIAFCIQQGFAISTKPAYRMFPVDFLKNMEAVTLFILMAIGNAGGFIPIYYITTYFQFARGDSPLNSAVKLLPLIIMISSSILISGALIGKFGYYKLFYLFGNVLALVGAVLLAMVTIGTSTSHIYGYEILIGIGSGVYAQAGYAVIQAVVEPAMMAYAISFMMLAQMFGILFGLSIAGSIFVNVASKNLRSVVPNITNQELQSALLGTSSNFLGSLGGETRTLALEAIIGAMRQLFIPAYVSFVVGLLAATFLNRGFPKTLYKYSFDKSASKMAEAT